jgi:hypothetical protein
VIRGKIWNDETILWWLRRNVLVFVEDGLLAGNERLRRAAEESAAYPLSLVHPEVYLYRMRVGMQAIEKMGQLAEAFGEGGLFRLNVGGDGRVKVVGEA